MTKKVCGWAGLLLLLPLCGCPVVVPVGPEAVLEGTWELTGSVVAPGVTDFLVTFNSSGEITRLSYTYGVFTIVVDDPSFIYSQSTVDGNDVNITVTWLTVNNLVFDGTLNSAQTQITGTASYRLVVGGITVDVPAGDAQFTKQ